MIDQDAGNGANEVADIRSAQELLRDYADIEI